MTSTVKCRVYGPLLLNRLFPGARGVELVGISYSAVDDHATVTLKGADLPESEYVHATTTHERPSTTFRPEVRTTKAAAE